MKRYIANDGSALISSWEGPHAEGEFTVCLAKGKVKSNGACPPSAQVCNQAAAGLLHVGTVAEGGEADETLAGRPEARTGRGHHVALFEDAGEDVPTRLAGKVSPQICLLYTSDAADE